MPKKSTNSGSESNLLSPINHIRFCEKGEIQIPGGFGSHRRQKHSKKKRNRAARK